MPIERLILDPTNMSITPIIECFLDRPRRLKYDEYNGKLYQIVWTPEAEKLRKERQLELRRQKYREEHPEKPKHDVSLYLRKKMKRIEAETALRTSVFNTDIAGNTVDIIMMSSQTVSSV
jgi:hypothetical protein